MQPPRTAFADLDLRPRYHTTGMARFVRACRKRPARSTETTAAAARHWAD